MWPQRGWCSSPADAVLKFFFLNPPFFKRFLAAVSSNFRGSSKKPRDYQTVFFFISLNHLTDMPFPSQVEKFIDSLFSLIQNAVTVWAVDNNFNSYLGIFAQ